MGNIYPDLTVDPDSPGALNFTAADVAFAKVVAAGFSPYIRLGNSGNDEGMHHWGSPNTTAQLPNIVKAMVKIVERYCDASRWAFPAEYIEVWNEPNQPGSWDPQGPG